MKITIEAQYVASKVLSGVPQYVIQLARALIKGGNNDYALSFFDYNREQDNRLCIDRYFGDLNPRLLECNSMHYGFLCDDRAYRNKSYNDYVNSDSDVFHFPSSWYIPGKISGKVVVTCHDVIPILPYYGVLPYKTPITVFSLGLERMYRLRPLIITGSFSAKEDILKYTNLPEEDIRVVYYGVNHEALFPDIDETVLTRLGIRKPYFMGLGTLYDYKKNVRGLVSAFERVAERYGEVQLVLAGSNTSEELQRFIEGSRFSNRIIMPGYVTDDERRSLLSATVSLVFPSIYEGFGLPIIEAMACGAPVITSNVSSMPEASGGAAILVDPNDVEQIAYEMEQVLNSSTLRDELSKQGLAHSAKFTWEKTAEETERVYALAREM